ncbi:S-layer homology domain-containing protein [Candidatus Saganbacteria bacterium]|nr:S-layer homology domain-containing protein [Candidatus Saganbacteria bacterium]
MKQTRIVAGALFLFCFCFPTLATVDITDIGVGARPLGMGKAAVGGLDDASALFTNPAALTLNPNLNIVSMNGKLFSEVNYIVLGAAESAPLGRFGIGYINAGVGGIPITTLTGTASTAAVSWESNADYYSSIISFDYATELSRLLRGRFSNVSLGASLKYFLQGFSGGQSGSSNPLADATGNGMDLDLGLTWQANSWLRLGGVANNVLPTAAGGKFKWTKNNVTEGIPLALRLGGNLKLLGPLAWRRSEAQKVDLNFEYEAGRESRPALWRYGVEFWPTQLLALRAGLDQKPKALSSGGIDVDNNLTAGVGLVFGGFSFDYAYHQFGDLTENATYFFSVGYRGEERTIARKMVDKLKKEPLLIAEVAPKPELKHFSDVPNNYWARQPIEYLAALGIMPGRTEMTFVPEGLLTRGELSVILAKEKIAKPEQTITRAEAAVMLTNFAGLWVKKKVSSRVYSDVSAKHWAAPAIAAGKMAGFYAYLAGQHFQPSRPLARSEAAEILSKIPAIKQKIKELISTNGEK